MNNTRNLICALFLGIVAEGISLGQPMYTITQLPSPNGQPNEVVWISDDGNAMYGGVWDPTVTNVVGGAMVQCYIAQGGNTTYFPTPGFSCNNSGGRTANSRGQFAGVLLPPQFLPRTAFASLDGTIDPYGTRLPDVDHTQYPACAPNCAVAESYSTGINDNGDVIGNAVGYDHILSTPDNPPNFIQYGYLYSKGQITRLPLRRVFGVNNQADICGEITLDNTANPVTHAAIYRNGTAIDMGSLGGISLALAINNNGQAVGYSTLRLFDPTDPQGSTLGNAFFYDGNVMTAIQVPNSALGSSATAINDNGEVIGTYNPDAMHQAAFYYVNGSAVDLNTLVINPPAGLNLNVPLYISNSGQILAASLGSGGLSGTYLLTPAAPAVIDTSDQGAALP